MGVFLAAISAVLYGGADFLGGLASRRAAASTVVVTSHLAGMSLVLAAAPLSADGLPPAADVAWGAAAGGAGAVGLVVLYHALATTRITVAAPAAALTGAVVPVLFGVAVGERPTAMAWIGVSLALPALLLIPAGRVTGGAAPSLAGRALAIGSAAGVAFGLFGILLSQTSGASGLWPLVGARAVSIPAVAMLAIGTRRPLLATRPVLWWGLLLGAADMAANILFLAALQRGLLSLVVVVSSLYPAVTIVLARTVLREEMTRTQVAGLLLAGAGIALMVAA